MPYLGPILDPRVDLSSGLFCCFFLKLERHEIQMTTPLDVGLKQVKRHQYQKVFLCACVLDPLASYSFSYIMQKCSTGPPSMLVLGTTPHSHDHSDDHKPGRSLDCLFTCCLERMTPRHLTKKEC